PLSFRSSRSFVVGESPKYDKAFKELCQKIQSFSEQDLTPDRPMPQRLIELGGRPQSTGSLQLSQRFSKRQRLVLSGITRVMAHSKGSPAACPSLDFLFSS